LLVATAAGCEVTLAAFVAVNLGAGPPQARADVVGQDLDLRALLALVVLPGVLLDLAGDDNPHALGEGLGDVLGHLAEAHHVEERGLLAVALALAEGDRASADGHAAVGEPQLGVAGQIAHDGDSVSPGH
jgi:hypothetical protein